ncbi:MAG: DUF456 domain-containing protein [Desulfovibrionaceae bacterium]|nr:DUF456 domain-containing protein [Desulfovibrionaceae bacterium]
MSILTYLSQGLAIAFVAFLIFLVFLNLINLPANWIVLIGIFGWSFFTDTPTSLIFWGFIIGTALLGEVLEWLVLAHKSKASGASSWGTFAGMLGAFAGAIFGAPFFLGLGALIGALIGAFAGCLALELLRGVPFDSALKAAKGTLMGRFLGSLCKCAAGFTMVAIAARHFLEFPALEDLKVELSTKALALAKLPLNLEALL